METYDAKKDGDRERAIAEATMKHETRFSVGERAQQTDDEQRNETLQRNREILKGVIDEGRRSGTLGFARGIWRGVG